MKLIGAALGAVVQHHPRRYQKVALRLSKLARSLIQIESSPLDLWRLSLITHYDGLLLHQLLRPDLALEQFDVALRGMEEIPSADKTERMVTEEMMLKAHRSASMHLLGESNAARDLAEATYESDPLRAVGSLTDAGAFSVIKLAEHHIVRSEDVEAVKLLRDLIHSDSSTSVQPIFRAIALKDWAVVHARNESRAIAIRAAVAGLALSEEFGFRDQRAKIYDRLQSVGVRPSDLSFAESPWERKSDASVEGGS